MLVPETPDLSSVPKPRRRMYRPRPSGPLTGPAASTSSALHVTTVRETPEGGGAMNQRTRTRVDDTPQSSQADPAGASPLLGGVQVHPLFQGGETLSTESSFVEWVAGTQDVASTRIEEESSTTDNRVEQWLEDNSNPSSPSPSRKPPPQNKKENLAEDLRMLLFQRVEKQQKPQQQGNSSPGPKKNRRRSSLLSGAKQPINSSPGFFQVPRRRTRELLSDSEVKRVVDVEEKEEEEVFLDATAAGSFKDFSSDSAKELIAKLTQGKDEVDLPPAEVSTETEEPEQEVDPKTILKEIKAFVEVRTKHENRSRCVQDQLEQLGAVVVPKLTAGVTHCVFKDGALATYNRAKRVGAHLVSVMWIEACRKEGKKVEEELFPTTSKQRYDSPGLFPKLRKAKSMQPKTEEEMAKEREAESKRRQRRRKKEEAAADVERKNAEEVASKLQYPKSLYFYNSPSATKVATGEKTRKKRDNKDSVMNVLKEIGSPLRTPKRNGGSTPRLQCEPGSPCASDDFDTPLARRLAKKYFTEKSQADKEEEEEDEEESAAASGSFLLPKSPLARAVSSDVVDMELTNLETPKVVKRGRKRKSVELNGSGAGPEAPKVLPSFKNHSRSKRASANTSAKAEHSSNGASPEEASPEAHQVSDCSSPGSEDPVRPKAEENTSHQEKKTPTKTDSVDDIDIDDVNDSSALSPVLGRRSDSLVLGGAAPPRRRFLFTQSEDPFAATPKNASVKKERKVTAVRKKAKMVKDGKGKVVGAVMVETGEKKKFKVPEAATSGKSKTKKEKKKVKKECLDSSSASSVVTTTMSETGRKVKRILPPRRSSVEFVKEENVEQIRNLKRRFHVSELVCTTCCRSDYDLAKQLTDRLSGLKLVKTVSERTTHVVSGDGKRTLNVMRGMLRGCWIVPADWLHASDSSNQWADPEPHELTSFSPAVRQTRLERQAFDGVFKSELFANCGAVYFSGRGCKAPARELGQLVRLGGGSVARVARAADIVVGCYDEDKEDSCVNETWLMDSIQQQKIMELKSYLMQE